MKTFYDVFGISLEGKSPAEVKELLQTNCYGTKNDVRYSKQLDKSELDSRKEQLSEVAIFLNDKEEEKKDFMAMHKEEIKPFVEEQKKILSELKLKSIESKADCFLFLDEEERNMYYVAENGDIVYVRGATPKEIGSRGIFELKTGTHE